jgi:hypothetical protein
MIEKLRRELRVEVKAGEHTRKDINNEELRKADSDRSVRDSDADNFCRS